ncbi:hypothetical protein Vadar_032734 [Vaccinium darrowii]|uniref:Uncharacterized protein n=1 Tax=Vaccinium darrowii TaxID=229202 RepID=A0ACB7ZGW7_9ERIC|nr:hypothetical protein Vadar_032734 [Vaccinium darrowii]
MYFDGSSAKLAKFRKGYNIPEDVSIARPTDGKIHYVKGQVSVPLMAITEGGLTFPMPRLLRQFLDVYELAPHQLVTNVYRIICSVVRLSERHNIPFRLADLMAVYTVARSRSYGRYYFSRRPEYPHLIGKLSDSERHACELVIVKGNFETAPGEESRWSVPWSRGRPNCRKLTKKIAEDADDDVIDRIFGIGNRTAPSILGYVPSYRGFLKRGKSPVKRTGERRRRLFDSDLQLSDFHGRERVPLSTQNPSQSPAIGSSPETDMAKSSALREAQKRERAEKKRKEAEQAASLESGSVAEGEGPPKKARTAEASEGSKASLPTPPPQTTPTDVPPRGTAPKDKQVASPTLGDTPPPVERDEPWVPVIQTSRGEPVKKNASVRESRKTAMTLLKALALPRDMKAESNNTADNYAEMCTHIVRARGVHYCELYLQTHRPRPDGEGDAAERIDREPGEPDEGGV